MSANFNTPYKRVNTAILPPVEFKVEQLGAGYCLTVTCDGERGTLGVYPTRSMAEKQKEQYAAKLKAHSREFSREKKKYAPLKIDRQALELYVMGLSKERRAVFLEGVMTFNFLLHMMTYCLDEAEDVWDGIMDKNIRHRWANVKKNMNGILDQLFQTRIAGETTDEYGDIAVSAQRLLDIVNIVANYTGKEGQWRLLEIERTVARVMPKEVLDQAREDRTNSLQKLIADQMSDILQTPEEVMQGVIDSNIHNPR